MQVGSFQAIKSFDFHKSIYNSVQKIYRTESRIF